MDRNYTPPVTVVISTRNRGDRVVKTVQTILENDYSHFELRVIDQSEDNTTENSLQPFLGDPRFHYLRTTTKGISIGRNLGISNTQNEFIALTDDDCETPAGWLRELVTAFSVDRRIGVMFGNALSAPHDSKAGFIPTYVSTKPFLAFNISDKYYVEGISACMGLRRSVWQVLGGFDEMLGAGAPFKAAEENDFTIRALLSGYFVYETPNVTVIHHGFRTWKQGLTLMDGYWKGTGAMFAKHFKSRHWPIVLLLLRLAWRWVFGHPRVNLGSHPPRWLRLRAFLCGFLAGLMNPVDRSKGHFVYRLS